MDMQWNMWHGCHKKSEGCLNCYVYRGDAKYDRDASLVVQTNAFYLPIQRKRASKYHTDSFKCPPGTHFWTCFSSDFLLEGYTNWRAECWEMMKVRDDCTFFFITKRIENFEDGLPKDWKYGYPNVTVGVTCENQKRVNERLPILNALPIKHKVYVHEPLLEEIDISPYLNSSIEQVVVGGESGPNARPCNYDWVLKIRQACIDKKVTFVFRQTGANFIKDGVLYKIPRNQQHSQATKAGINYIGRVERLFNLEDDNV